MSNPHSAGSVTASRAAMFDSIAARYDMVNRLTSLGLDATWRRHLLRQASAVPHAEIIDVACGSGALSSLLARALPGARIHGCDISEGMLRVAHQRVERLKLEERVSFSQCEAEALRFPDHSADLVTIAFGTRNFTDPHAGIREAARVLKPGGHLLILEFTWPKAWCVRAAYWLYCHTVLLLLGGLLTGQFGAYLYLPRSIREFSEAAPLRGAIPDAGLLLRDRRLFSAGLVELLLAQKPHE